MCFDQARERLTDPNKHQLLDTTGKLTTGKSVIAILYFPVVKSSCRSPGIQGFENEHHLRMRGKHWLQC